jgi:predicted amidophosphoribosyltransferase
VIDRKSDRAVKVTRVNWSVEPKAMPGLMRRSAVNTDHEAEMAYLCPACSRAILSRRNKLCSFCGKPLPADLLFTAAEIAKIEAAERERAIAREGREEEREEARKRRANDLVNFSGG